MLYRKSKVNRDLKDVNVLKVFKVFNVLNALTENFYRSEKAATIEKRTSIIRYHRPGSAGAPCGRGENRLTENAAQ